MATLTFTIPDEQVPRYLQLAEHYGYKDTLIDGEPNPESKAAFIKRKMKQEMKYRVRQVEFEKAADEIDIEEIDIE